MTNPTDKEKRSELLLAFMRRHKIEDNYECSHGCQESHRAISYQISHDIRDIDDDGPGPPMIWGSVTYDCPKAIAPLQAKIMFPLSAKEREEMRQMYVDLVGEQADD